MIACLNNFLSDALAFLKGIVRPGVRFNGPYNSWAAARSKAMGYDSKDICERGLRAAKEVISGRAVFERDGVVFYHKSLPEELLIACLLATSENKGTLCVLDFGGGFASHFLQIKDWLKFVPIVSWNVVEQPHIVKIASPVFDTEELQFHSASCGVLRRQFPSIAIFSSVLQYLEDPTAAVQEVIDANVPYIFIDRTPFHNKPTSIFLQTVPKRILDSSYPAWIFNEPELLRLFEGKYEVLHSFDALDGKVVSLTKNVQFRGHLLRRLEQ